MNSIYPHSVGKVIILFSLINVILLMVFFIVKGYPTLCIVLHFLSIIFLWIYVLKPQNFFKAYDRYKIDLILLIILFSLSVFFRLLMLSQVTPGFDGDEVAVAQSSEELREIGYTPFIFNNYGHGTIIPYMVGLSIDIFGKSIEAIRLPSIVFGALGICAFYVLVRLFMKKDIAFFTSLLFAFSYAHFALSRVIFEPTASIFFEILTLIFLYLALTKNDFKYYMGVGLSLALGNYTYVNFRSFTLFVLFVILVVLVKKRKPFLEKMFPFLLVVIIFLFSITPLIHYGVMHPDHLFARTKVLSLFHQNLSSQEILQNCIGNILQLRYIFLFPGDPNNRINPAGISMLDIGTSFFMFGGIVYLWRKSKYVLFLFSFFLLPFIISDIFAYESGPANTFYGFAHPNTLRISGILPILYLFVGFGFLAVLPYLHTINKTFYKVLFMGIVICIGTYNMVLFFTQPYNAYTYAVNGVRELDIVSFINNSSYKTVYISPSIAKDSRFIYFQKRFPTLNKTELSSIEETIKVIKKYDLTIIDVRTNGELAKKLVEGSNENKEFFTRSYYRTPIGQIDTLIYTKE